MSEVKSCVTYYIIERFRVAKTIELLTESTQISLTDVNETAGDVVDLTMHGHSVHNRLADSGLRVAAPPSNELNARVLMNRALVCYQHDWTRK